jgi:S1-C subfamily serine protease
MRVLIGIGVCISLVMLMIYIVNKNANSKSKPQNLAQFSASVLTIIGYDGAGNEEVQGSGFILTSDGLGATNYHVLEGAQTAIAQCCNGRKFEIIAIEGADADKDLVVFRLREQGASGSLRDLPSIPLETSGDISVGEKITAIGSPQGLENTVSEGIISAIRSNNSVRYLQITAPISPGSSGGPVLDESGRIVGIVTMQMNTGQNLNFAVSSEYLQSLLNQHLQLSLSELWSDNRLIGAATESTASSIEEQNRRDADLGSFTGEFAGIVHNDTVNVSAKFGLLVEETDNGLDGCFVVLRPLGGSGPINGLASGEDIRFVATSGDERITFNGKRTKRSITGRYIVEKATGDQEEGWFSAKKSRILDTNSRLDLANCPTDAELQSAN